jgi:phosphatidylserine decarboxylase
MDPTLEVTLSRGIDLISCDRLGSSDPFVVLTYGEVRHKTHVKRNTLNPRWAEVK